MLDAGSAGQGAVGVAARVTEGAVLPALRGPRGQDSAGDVVGPVRGGGVDAAALEGLEAAVVGQSAGGVTGRVAERAGLPPRRGPRVVDRARGQRPGTGGR